ncbi:uncharacterized protein LOC131415035 [Diceros bicornis minor]|uniref:uncharacterized protein LOC131415035 n=1 Tax=Diceros bicornis minor TaxID=77932 RepID=UPI0026F23885|nr:uncharacterized protein LOC131415035 [Diceros bicornis minor]
MPNLMAFPPKLVVEQLTLMDAECKILKNFSSPCIVISALQKTSTNHLKNTRGKFPGGESSERLKECYCQDESLSRELMTKINKQRDLFCPWAGGEPFVGGRPWSWDTMVLAGLFHEELPSWHHQQEGPSTFAPRRATPRECRRSSSSSRVLSPILALSSVTC